MKFQGTYMTMAILVVAAMLAAGCAGTSKPSTFYLLESLPDSGQSIKAAADTATPSVLVGPITLSAYLDRLQIVTVSDGHQLILDEFDRWAEPLKDNFYRVLAENLSLLMDTPAVYAYDRRGNKASDFRVVIDVTRFDFSTNGQAHLTAFWTVSRTKDKVDLIQRKSVIRVPGSQADAGGKIDGQNQALTLFTREIASAIQSLQ